jgi:AAA domain
MTDTLNARLEAQKLRELYINDPRQDSFKLLITGEHGTGKTMIARTARMPVHIDSFDPGGTKGLRDLIIKGDIIADTRYESEDPLKPTSWREWVRNFEDRLRKRYFEPFATYMLDSSTFWAEACMNAILLRDKRAGEAPNFYKDYNPQKVLLNNYMHQILDLPCDVIVTGHLAPIYESRKFGDEEQQVVTGMRYMTTGKGAIILPLLFDEIWNCTPRDTARGPEYRVQTAKAGLYLAKTRIGAGKFDTYEIADIKALLRKAGLAANDKPRLEAVEVDKEQSHEISA